MKRNNVKFIKTSKKAAGAILLSAALILTGCSSSSATTQAAQESVSVEVVESTDVASSDLPVSTTAEQVATKNTTTTASSANISSLLTEKVEYDADDAYTDYKTGTYTTVKLNGSTATVSGSGASFSNGVLTISKAGTYVLSGNLNGYVLVNAAKTDDVRIVLNGVTITSTKTAPIQVYQADQVMISLEKGTTNTITDAKYGTATNAAGDEITAAIFSKEDIIINGEGKLVVNAKNNDGITSKDDLIIISGNIVVNAVDDGLVGKDSVQIAGGTINITSTGDGIKSTNDTDAGEGYVLVGGGTITVSSGDDAVKGEQQVIIAAGTVNITKSVEGIEAMDIVLAGGTVNLVASDDGINASGKTSGNTVSILGGTINVNAQGDGLDANGSITMSGGTVTVNGPTNGGNGAIDADQGMVVTGGTLNVAGSAGMAQAPANSSTQGVVSMTFTSSQAANTTVTLKDSSGKVIATITPTKTFQNVIFSNANIKAGGTYTITAGGKDIVTFTTSSTVTYVNNNGVTQGGMGGPGQGGNMGKGQPPTGQEPSGGKGQRNGNLAEPPGGFGGDRPAAPPGGYR